MPCVSMGCFQSSRDRSENAPRNTFLGIEFLQRRKGTEPRRLCHLEGGSGVSPLPGYSLPIHWLKILQEFSPDVLARIEPRNNGIDDSGGSVNDVQRRMKMMVASLASGNVDGILIGDPAGIDAIHVNAVGMIIRSRGPGHHVECRL